MMDNNEEKDMVLGLENKDPDSDGTRIVIQEQLETGNVDLLSQMWERSKTDANGYFTLKSIVSFNNPEYNNVPGKVLTIDPESMSVTADNSEGIMHFYHNILIQFLKVNMVSF